MVFQDPKSSINRRINSISSFAHAKEIKEVHYIVVVGLGQELQI
ncbi:hypothetical protein CHISP_1026 [Chitinispirillum alkaliphilum]|nr:hypothetical protein CHISP_1026 [Chitinispirillum alkaliphilum]